MDTAYISTIAALAGSPIGGVTSLATSLLGQHTQFRTQQRAPNLSRREELYKDFIEEASKLYVDAYEHEQAEVSNLVSLYALISKMRILSSRQVIESADHVARVIFETYSKPKEAFRDVLEIVDNKNVNPLRDFGNACREEFSYFNGR
jgi:hypothetical protein